MIKNIDILIKNINKVTEIGSYVFIFCLDGEKIFNLLNNTNKYEIMFNKEPYWGVYQYNDIVPNKFNSDFKIKLTQYFVSFLSNHLSEAIEFLLNCECCF
jgi:hypothetical protein